MDELEFGQHWVYFCSLAERLDETKHYIDHGIHNIDGSNDLIHGEVYSNIFKQIIVLAASEFEVMSKVLCLRIGSEKNHMNIKDISSVILKKYPQITSFEVITPFWITNPIGGWSVRDGKVDGLEWWNAYNSIKHGNKGAMKMATLRNAIISLGALYIINLYLMYEMFENLGFAFAYPAVYFKCKYMAYPVSSGEGKLPDFGNMTAQERIQQDYFGEIDY